MINYVVHFECIQVGQYLLHYFNFFTIYLSVVKFLTAIMRHKWQKCSTLHQITITPLFHNKVTNICITFIQCWPNFKGHTNVLRLMGHFVGNTSNANIST